MEKFFIRYHIVGDRAVIDSKEFGSLGEAIVKVGNSIRKAEWVAAVKNDGHLVEIKTKYITHFEVMTEKSAKLESDLNALASIAKRAFK
ncbi:hypothetical protein [Cytobacillus kochii]|uniref:hypothetical protein n=1 Tax=Cytobacillus kochii TaxID=859143 RepID=UPI003F804EFD